MNEHSQAPKVRPALPPRYSEIYEDMYKANRSGAGLASFMAQKMEAWMHKSVASTGKTGNKILEIGAGTLNQVRYELKFNPVYDIVEPFKSLYADSPCKTYIKNIYTDISEIEEGEQYDRIISIATFEHILDLHGVMVKVKSLLKPGGVHCVAIPNEGYFLWKLGYMMTTGLAFRFKYGLDYSVIMRHEHVNDADEIEALLHLYHRKVSCSFFGLSKRLSLYRVYICGDD